MIKVCYLLSLLVLIYTIFQILDFISITDFAVNQDGITIKVEKKWVIDSQFLNEATMNAYFNFKN